MKKLLKGILFIALALSLVQGVATVFSDTEAGFENYQAGSVSINLETYSPAGELYPGTPETYSFLVENTGTLPLQYEVGLSLKGDLKNKINIILPISSQVAPGQVDTVSLNLLLANGVDPTLKGKSDTLEITVSAKQLHAVGGFRDEQDLNIPLTVASPVPTFNILSPTSGTVSGEILIQVETSDPFGVSGVYFTVDQDNQKIHLTNTGANNYELLWDTTNLSNGTHTLHIVVYDALNQIASDLVQLTISN